MTAGPWGAEHWGTFEISRKLAAAFCEPLQSVFRIRSVRLGEVYWEGH